MNIILQIRYNIFPVLKGSILFLILVALFTSAQAQSESRFQFEIGGGFRSEYLGELATSTFFLVGHQVHLKHFDIGIQYTHGLSSFGHDLDRNYLEPNRGFRALVVAKQELRHTSNLILTLRRHFNFFHLSPFIGVGVGLQYRPALNIAVLDNIILSPGPIPVLSEGLLTSNVYRSYALEFGYIYNNIGNRIIINFTGKSFGHTREQNFSYKPRPLISLATTYSIGEKDFKKKSKKKTQASDEENYFLLMDIEAGMLHTFPVGNKNLNASNTHLYFESGFYFLKRFGLSCFFQFPGRRSGKHLSDPLLPIGFDENASSETQVVQGAFNYAIINKEKLRLEGSLMVGKFETEDFGAFGWTIRLSLKSGLFKNALYFSKPGRGFPNYFGWQTGLRLNFRKRSSKAN